jgi:hypothetical protein
MKAIGRILKEILVWSYERGTLQYDIICALILAFIFLVPRGCFSPRSPEAAQQTGHGTPRATAPARPAAVPASPR